MYLRLRMGRQIGKNTPLPTTVMSYGKNKLRPEYWFSIPKNKWVSLCWLITEANLNTKYLFAESTSSTVSWTRGSLTSTATWTRKLLNFAALNWSSTTPNGPTTERQARCEWLFDVWVSSVSIAKSRFQDGGDIGDEIGEYTRESWEVSSSTR